MQCVDDCKHTAMKRIQSNQKENLTGIMKSDKELQCVRPQIRDHSNKVLTSKVFNRSIGLSMSSNVWALCSFHTNHIRHVSTYSKYLKKISPSKKKRDNCTRHHLLNPKHKTSLHKARANLQ